MQLKKRNITFELKSLSEGGIITGYASLFGVKDSYDDVVAKGAFEKYLKTNPHVPILWQHSPDEPIGIWTSIEEDAVGLKVIGKLTLSVPRAQQTYDLLKDGAIKGLSIGFLTRQSSYDEKTWVRTITEAELWEVSVVTFPALSAAGVTEVKSTPTTNKDLERLLTRDAGLSRSFARALMSGGATKALAQRDAGEGEANDDDDLEPPITRDADEAAIIAELKSMQNELRLQSEEAAAINELKALLGAFKG